MHVYILTIADLFPFRAIKLFSNAIVCRNGSAGVILV